MGEYVVAGRAFPTKEAVTLEISRILVAGPDGSAVIGKDLDFVLGLIGLREDKLREIGERSILDVIRDLQPGKVKFTRCFWVILSDGRIDVSLYKAVARLAPATR